MPRITAKKKDYRVADLRKWIAGQMYLLGLKQSYLAEKIGITQPSFCQRLKKGLFTYEELLVLLDELHATDEEILKMMKLKKERK